MVYIIRYPTTKILGLTPLWFISFVILLRRDQGYAPMIYIIRYPTTKISGLRPYGLYHPLSYYEDIRATLLWFISFVILLRRDQGYRPFDCIIRYLRRYQGYAPMVYIFRYPITKRSGLRIPHSFIVLPNVFL
jgi:hypothetical protein